MRTIIRATNIDKEIEFYCVGTGNYHKLPAEDFPAGVQIDDRFTAEIDNWDNPTFTNVEKACPIPKEWLKAYGL